MHHAAPSDVEGAGFGSVVLYSPSPETARHVAHVLALCSVGVVSCGTPDDLARAAGQENADAVLIEVSREAGKAFAACRRLARRADAPPVVLAVGPEVRDAAARARRAGASAILVKPINPRELASRVRMAVRLGVLRREHAALAEGCRAAANGGT